jgi:enediyne polyketide synthase
MNEGIAIVGMGCRFPDARSPDELWENVLARRQAFRRLPDERLRLDDYRQGAAAPRAPAPSPSPSPSPAGGLAEAAAAADPDSIYLREAAVLAGWEFDRLRFRVAGATFRVTDLTHWLALEVAAATLADAGFEDGAGLPRDATGVLVGNTLTGEFSRAQLMRMRWPYVRRVLGAALAAEGWAAVRVEDFLARLEPSYKAPFPAPTEESLAGGLSNTIAGRICNHFDLHGGGYTMDGACASSLLAVAQACSALAAGDLDVALAGGVDLSLDPFELIGFARAGALAAGDMRVFDARSAGFLPGEGCGFVALMRERQALAWGKRIHGVIRGWGISSDGHGGLSRPEAAGQRLAIARAYRRAGFDVGTVSCFEGHGTGTTVGDAAELAALAGSLRAGSPPSPPPAAIGSIKANIGHTKAAAGIAGLLKATLAVESQVLPPATGCEEPHAALAGADPVLRVLAAAEPWPAGRPLRAGVSAMGFGGVNAHVVVDGPAAARRRGLSVRERRLAAPPQDVELALLAGADAASLAAAARQLAELAPRLSRAELGDVAAALHRRWRDARGGDGDGSGSGGAGGGGWRAAIVAATPRELGDRTALLIGWLERGVTRRLDPRQGVFLGASAPGATPPRVGLLFTGQGSPAYADASGAMGRGAALARRFADLDGVYGLAAECVAEIAACETAAAGAAAGAAEAGAQGEAAATGAAGEMGTAGGGAADRGLDTAVAQPAIVAHSLAGAWLLDRLAVRGGVAVGHSLGEISALCWGGACTAAAALRLAAARGRAMAERGELGAMASLGAPPAVVAEILEGIAAGEVSIAAYNGATRTVVTGAPAAVAAVVERAAARGLTASRLKVTRAFHSPRVAAAAADLDRALATVAWAPLRRAVASTVSGSLLAPDADPRGLLLAQVTAPVRFTEALDAARPLADLWIEVGPGRALAELAAEALDEPVLALDAGSPSLAGPWSTAAALFAAGVPLDVAVLFEGRFHRPFDLDAPLRFLANPCESAPLPARAAAGPAIQPAESRPATQPAEPGPAMQPDAARSAAAADPLPAAEQSALLTSTGPSGPLEPSGPLAFAERAEALASAGRTQPPAAAAVAAAPPTPIELLRGLVAARAELPASAVRDDSRLLSDLHLNSITVGQLVVEASRQLGLGPPASPTDYALATVAEVAAALAERARLAAAPPVASRGTSCWTDLAGGGPGASGEGIGGDPEDPTGVAGIDSWVRPFTVALVERPLPPHRLPARPGPPAAVQQLGASPRAGQESGPDCGPAVAVPGDSPPTARGAAPVQGGGGWRVIALDGHALAPAIAAALSAAGPQSGPESGPATSGEAPAGVLLCLPAQLDECEPGHLDLFVTAARAAAGPPPTRRFVVVQHGGGGGGFARTVHLELPGVTTRVIDLPANAAPAAAAAWVVAEVAADDDRTDRTDRHAGRTYVEAHYDAAGTRRVPVLRLLPVTNGSPAAAAPPHEAAATAAGPPATATGSLLATRGSATAPRAAAAAAAASAPPVALATATASADSWEGLGADDVLLVTGGGKGIGAECALAAARTAGARLAILGRSDPRSDPELAANLERMAAAGIRTLYLRADVADETAVRAAIARADAELGPITALLHAAGANAPRALGAVDEEGLRRTLAPKVAGARHLLAALASRRPDRLRLIVGFGSIIARTGLRGEAEYALANEWLALLLARHAARHPACRCLVLDWSVWSGTGMGERLGTLEALTRQGIVPIPPGAGVAELLRLLADPAVRGEVVVTGRFGDPPTLAVERPELPLLRFLEQPRVYFPGVELVADVAVSADSDPYLSDHVFRGEPLFAAVVGLEAMAQAAAAVTGAMRPPVFEQVELLRPVAVAPGRSTTLRLAALVRAPGRVEVALRDRQTGFAADHFRAFCRFDLGDLDEGSLATAMAADAANARSAGTATAGTALRPWEPPPVVAARLAIDPRRDLYGGILFQEGRFRRLGGYRRLRATECLAEIVPDGTAAWFGRYLPPALLLGDPAARDAAIHGIQACIPHAQLLPIGIERILAGRLTADEPLLLAARERHRDGDTFVYDLDILAADGSLRERWQGLRLRAVDRTRLPTAWSAPLLAPYLERRLQELFPEANLRVALEAPAAPRAHAGTEPSAGGRAPRLDSALIVENLVAASAMTTSEIPHAVIGASATPHAAISTGPLAPNAPPRLFHRPDGRPEIPGGPQVSVAHAASLVLAIAAIAGEGTGDPIGCDLEPVVERTADTWRDLLGAERFALAQLIAGQPGELPGGAATRIWTAAESLHKAGSSTGAPLLLEASLDDGWLLLRSGSLRIASFATTLRELGGPCALAVAAPAGDPGRH